jgi:hypothetical protein
MLQVVRCPNCKQKLGISDTVVVGASVVCANVQCGTPIRVVSWKPFKIEQVPIEQTRNPSSRPESYG